MTREQFRNLFENRILVLDGATGTNLMKAGMPMGVCPEQWILEHPQVMIDLQERILKRVRILFTHRLLRRTGSNSRSTGWKTGSRA